MHPPVDMMPATAAVETSQAATVAPNSTGTESTKPAHALERDQMNAMLNKLAERLKQNPNDADGWAMLARSYAVTGQHAQAVPAFEKAVALRKSDATLLADYADALAVTQQKNLEGKPSELIQEALTLDPENVKALSLAGTAAFNRKDYPKALMHWEKLLKIAPQGSVFFNLAQAGVDDVHQLMTGKAPSALATTPLENISGTSVQSQSSASDLRAQMKKQIRP